MNDGSAVLAFPLPRPRLAVRVGDILSIADALRLALELADVAIELADHGGHAPLRVSRLRVLLLEIKRGG